MRPSFRVIATLLSLVVAAAAEGPLTPLQSLRIYTINRWLKPSSTPLQIAAVASLRGGGGGEVVNVVCTLRGKKYDVSATTVADVWAAIEDQAGLEPAKQGVIFKGKKLTDGEESLLDAGISEGDTVNIVPQKKASSGGEAKAGSALEDVLDEGGDDDDDDDDDVASSIGDASAAALGGMSAETKESVSKMMEEMGGQQGMKDMMKQMGLDGPMTADKVDGVLSQIKSMFSNPAIAQLFDNPEILEQSRQHILSNPMMMDMYDKMGMGGLIRDPDTFRKQMESMKKMMENPDMLKGAMEGLSDSKLDQFDDGDL
jgi:hypothetical protein